jgi:DNA-binding LacI/PurR family transcriptional regulator
MAELGYEPRPNRRRMDNLAVERQVDEAEFKASAGQVLLLIPDPNPAAAHTYQMQGIARGAAEWLGEFGLDMITGSMGADGRLPYCLRKRQVQGVILRTGPLTVQQQKTLAQLPCVQFFSTDYDSPGDQVVTDNEAIGRMAAEHLIRQGCDQLVALNPDHGHPAFHQRAQAFDFGVRIAGLTAKVVEVAQGSRLRDRFPEINCRSKLGIFIVGYDRFNDPPVVNRQLAQAGLTVENGVHIIGATAASAEVDHPVIAVAPERIGRHAAEQLVWRMQHPDADRRRIMIEPRLVEAVSVERGARRVELGGKG